MIIEPAAHSEETLFKVLRGLLRAGLSEQLAVNAISQMQNEGILFRERAPDVDSPDDISRSEL